MGIRYRDIGGVKHSPGLPRVVFTRVEFAGHIRGDSPPGTKTDADTGNDGAVIFRHR